jgi:hypothetical protein
MATRMKLSATAFIFCEALRKLGLRIYKEGMLMEFERLPNKVLEKFRKGKIPYGMGMYSQSPELYELVGWAGFDFVVIDMEHCRVNPERLTELIRICDMSGLTPFVRVPLNDELSPSFAVK